MSRLKTDAIRNTSASADALTFDTNGHVTAPGNATITGQLKTAGIRNASASSDSITFAADGTCTAKITNNLSNRNLIINGAMNLAQRGTSSTTSGCYSVDRWQNQYGNIDEAPTQAQIALTSSDAGPWEKGVRYALQITNGNQTSGAGAGDYMESHYRVEAQDMANSGWNYNSVSSKITLSFWVKSSVAQTFYGYLYTADSTAQQYPFSLGALSANTWTKVTKTIPGHANITINNDIGEGFRIAIVPFYGTTYTDSGVTLDAWGAYSGTATLPDNTSTWYTTNDATFAITGIQLEVGDVATDFEHRSYADELVRCQRYYQLIANGLANYFAMAYLYVGTVLYAPIRYATPMRTGPALDYNTGAYYTFYRNNAGDAFETLTWSWANEHSGALHHSAAAGQISGTAGQSGGLFCNHASGKIALTAEL